MSELSLGQDSIRVLQREQLTDKSVLFVSVDVGALSPQKAKQYLESVREKMKEVVAPAQVVVHTSKISLTLYEAPSTKVATELALAYDEAMQVV